jgi:hypothetical protein
MSIEAARRTNAAIYRGELAVRAGLADRVGTLDLAIAEMAAELDRTPPIMSVAAKPNTQRSASMATNETEQIADQPAQEPAEAAGTPARTDGAPPAGAVGAPPRPDEAARSDVTEQLRAEFAEIASVATQAARLGVQVDAADAVRKGISAETLRRTVLETLASRAEASSVIAVAPAAAAAGESPIVRRAKERAAATPRS